jgi:hypothetical protein
MRAKKAVNPNKDKRADIWRISKMERECRMKRGRGKKK